MTDLSLFQIEKNSDDIRRTMLTNIVKMLTERTLLPKDKLEENIEKLSNLVTDDLIYTIPLNKGKGEKESTFAIKISFQKITAINKSFGVNDFLMGYKSNPKLVVVKDISKKALQYIMNNYPNTEIFLEKELMINLVDHVLIPKHEILQLNTLDDFLDKYDCKKRNMPKILSTDPVARYYNMQPGMICRIMRPSDKSGFVITYRLVVKGSAT